MKNYYYPLLLLFLLSAWNLQAQPTCENPLVEIDDDIENYATGDVTMQSDDWSIWPGGATGGIVSMDYGSASVNSIKIDGNLGGQDVLLLLGEKTSGHYLLQFQLYIPSGNNAYLNLQHEMPTSTAGYWGFDLYFNDGGEGVLELLGETATFSFPQDTWFKVHLLVDIDNDQARLIVNQYTVDSWAFSSGYTNGGAEYPSGTLSAVNFYPVDGSYVFYIDNVKLWEIPAPETGQYCYTAVELPEPGFYDFPGLACYGAGYDLDSDDTGFAGYWFSYTPTEDGVMYISSCGGGIDSRGWIFSGDCQHLLTVGVNDDRCDTGLGDDYASYREAVVTAGTTYYILWDDIWETDGFGFQLGFSTEAPTPGEFCQSALQVVPGEYEILEITGEAAVAGPNINNTTGSTTSYTQSKWYRFIPTAHGYMSIDACELAASDTHFFVYTGDCSSFEGLTLVAQNDNGCDVGQLTSSLDSIEVFTGTPYLIEWIDRWEDEPFIWTLGFEPFAASTVTFSVDMQLETVDPAGVFIAGPFSGFNNLPMADDDGDGVYTTELVLDNNATHTYKFKNGPDGWESINTSIGDNCTIGDFADRYVEVIEQDIMLDETCFGYCVSCATVDVGETELAAGIGLFPNPTTGMLNLRYDFGQNVHVLDIRLMDVMGRQLKHMQWNDIQSGTGEISLEGLPAGTYLLQLAADGARTARPVAVK
ncbi:MAG: T9SS type A sorting domain-containing protein [Phaeodactylibacter sp.]|nr:T9SS type A sorting domain-containing protein [Phaeodactylibacter sp.]MCB9276373.1 T9SS type A sorting domain-containing protein [Lewinellaceae bacterium]